MRRFGSITLIAFVVLAARSSAQQPANTVPKYDANGALSASNLTEVSGNLGIGTSSPTSMLMISGNGASVNPFIRMTDTNTGGHTYSIGPISGAANFDVHDVTANAYRLSITGAGNVGIGTPNPDARLEVITATTAAVARFLNFQGGYGRGIELGGAGSGGPANYLKSYGTSFPLYFKDADDQINMAILDSGSVGIGTVAPIQKLHVEGNVHVSGNISAKFQDVAEWVEAVEPIEAGSVVIVDASAANHVKPSTRAYDTLVAGAVSYQPGIILGEAAPNKERVAQSGRVKVKVDASYGPIAIGDLLVTSSTPGHAMRSTPLDLGGVPIHRPGTILGKALESLSAGKGEILVLLTLQ